MNNKCQKKHPQRSPTTTLCINIYSQVPHRNKQTNKQSKAQIQKKQSNKCKKNHSQCTLCMNTTPILVVIAKKQLAQQTTKIINNTTINKQTTNANFYRLKVFIGPKVREVSTGNFHRKALKWAKIRSKCQKLTKLDPLCIRPTVGIHHFCHRSCCGNP